MRFSPTSSDFLIPYSYCENNFRDFLVATLRSMTRTPILLLNQFLIYIVGDGNLVASKCVLEGFETIIPARVLFTDTCTTSPAFN